MKLLRNPWVTGVLAVVAVAVVCYQFMPRGGVHLNWFRSKQAPAPSVASVTSQTKIAPVIQTGSASRQSSALAESQALPERRMDRRYAASHFANWVNSPLRDPFLLLDTVEDQKPRGETNSPVASWKLDGIWHQTDSQLAIINNKVYAEGDEVAKGYTLQKIEGDEVWFQGPDRKERLGFRALGRMGEMNPTNPPSELNQPRESRPRP